MTGHGLGPGGSLLGRRGWSSSFKRRGRVVAKNKVRKRIINHGKDSIGGKGASIWSWKVLACSINTLVVIYC